MLQVPQFFHIHVVIDHLRMWTIRVPPQIARLKGLEGLLMPITFDRRICCDLNETIAREWLVTNGLGGYAAGTVAGVLTRMQHGLLVAIPPGEVIPHIFLAKIDEEVIFDQRTYYLG